VMWSFFRRQLKRVCRRLGLVDVVHDVRVVRYSTLMSDSLAGKNILITGGSSGIGLAIAKKCLASGASVLITGRDDKKLQEVVRQQGNSRIGALVWDVESIDSILGNVNRAFDLFGGRLDVLINNAGISVRECPGTLTSAIWDKIMRINLRAPVFITQAVCEKRLEMKAQGVVLNVSSMAGVEPAIDAYSAGKCAVNSMTKGMARYYAKAGIRINAIAPGVVIGTNLRDLQRSYCIEDNLYAEWIPACRYGVPDEIAELAAFVVSDASPYMTGVVITCDGAGAIRN